MLGLLGESTYMIKYALFASVFLRMAFGECTYLFARGSHDTLINVCSVKSCDHVSACDLGFGESCSLLTYLVIPPVGMATFLVMDFRTSWLWDVYNTWCWKLPGNPGKSQIKYLSICDNVFILRSWKIDWKLFLKLWMKYCKQLRCEESYKFNLFVPL